MDFAEGLYAITITLHIAQLCLMLTWNPSNTGLILVVLVGKIINTSSDPKKVAFLL